MRRELGLYVLLILLLLALELHYAKLATALVRLYHIMSIVDIVFYPMPYICGKLIVPPELAEKWEEKVESCSYLILVELLVSTYFQARPSATVAVVGVSTFTTITVLLLYIVNMKRKARAYQHKQ